MPIHDKPSLKGFSPHHRDEVAHEEELEIPNGELLRCASILNERTHNLRESDQICLISIV